jgi:hypothetical protein
MLCRPRITFVSEPPTRSVKQRLGLRRWYFSTQYPQDRQTRHGSQFRDAEI